MIDNIDFLFDGEWLSDHGMVICFFEGASKEWSGGEITFTTVKPPNSDKQTFYVFSFDTPLSCTFSICKNPCDADDEMELTREEYGSLMRWLVRTDGYKWLQFNTPEYEDVYFNCYINAAPHMLGGMLVGLDLTITTDSPYGYSKLYKRTWDSSQELSFLNYSDKPGIIYPKCTIRPKASGDIYIESGMTDDSTTTEIKSVTANSTIVLDKENDIALGFELNNFNFKYPIIKNAQYDRNTYFKKLSDSVDFDMDIEFRFVRWVVAP